MLPTIERIKPNFTKIVVGFVTVWYSYNTPVAFVRADGRKFVHENIWSNTTGKHLNAIDGGSKEAKASRIGSAEFKVRLNEATK